MERHCKKLSLIESESMDEGDRTSRNTNTDRKEEPEGAISPCVSRNDVPTVLVEIAVIFG